MPSAFNCGGAKPGSVFSMEACPPKALRWRRRDTQKHLLPSVTKLEGAPSPRLFTVNLETRSCNCGLFQALHFPCSHPNKCGDRVPSSFATLGKRRFCVSRLLQRDALGEHASMLETLPGLAPPQLKALGVLAHPSQLW
ncbi:hypothetical protein PIB30_073908 [Stylosanthes scabra]|uniref:SWIM-type domain-containing protein n=1 Tax=Stylosanthes scabra TaxID=79078 RepID=A0ABU6TP61_9FABA|nr:hypothetical protein [Stylosanthes scabra]